MRLNMTPNLAISKRDRDDEVVDAIGFPIFGEIHITSNNTDHIVDDMSHSVCLHHMGVS